MLALSTWQLVGTTSESYHPQLVYPDEIVKDSNISIVTPPYHPQFVDPSNDVKSDSGHDNVVPDAPLGGNILEFVMVTNNTYKVMPTPPPHHQSIDEGYVA